MRDERLQPAFKRISRPAVPDAVVNQVRELIDSEQLKPGDRLPSERDLSRQLGIGRSSVREALRVLRALDLISVERGKGTYVSEQATTAHTSLQELRASNFSYTLEETLELRFPLECKAAELACKNASESDLNEIEGILSRFRKAAQAGDIIELAVCDTAFHSALMRAAGNRLLGEMFSFILEYTVRYRRAGWESLTDDRRPGVVDDHEALLLAIKRKDVESAIAVTRHMLVDFAHQVGVTGFTE